MEWDGRRLACILAFLCYGQKGRRARDDCGHRGIQLTLYSHQQKKASHGEKTLSP